MAGLVAVLLASGHSFAQSTDAQLADLTSNIGLIEPAFSPVTSSYTLTLGAATTAIKLIPTASDPAASIKVAGATVASGAESGAITLHLGANTITTEVTAEDGVTKKSYVVQVNVLSLTVTNNLSSGAGSLRQAIANAALASGTDTVVFAPAMSGKTITLDSEIDVSDPEGLIVDASGLTAGVIISGNNTVRIFDITSGSNVTLSKLTFRNGVSGGGSGGAIRSDGDVTINGCAFTANSAQNGGAVYSHGTLLMTRCTLTGNTASDSGGALWATGPGSVTHCTLSKNRSDSGGGAFIASGNVSFDRSIVAGNSTVDGLSASEVAGGGTAGQTQSLIGGDPKLSPLGSYGGPTQTMGLLAGSPARDGVEVGQSTADQRGFPIVGNADIGAFESQIGSIVDQSILQNSSTGPLAFTVGTVGTLTATSSNLTVVPASKVVLGGSGASRTLTITPATGKFGTLTITVADTAHGESMVFELEVRGFGTFVFSQTGYSVDEGNKAMVEILRTQGTGGSASITVATSTASVSPAKPATAGTDYTADSETLTFADGEDRKTIEIDTTNDLLVEGNENFLVKLSVPTGSTAVLGTPATCSVTIVDPSAVLPDDSGLPTVGINTPAASAVVGVPNAGSLTIQGTAADLKGVAKVEARVIAPVGATTGFSTATLGAPGSTSTGYAVSVTPPTGLTTVEVVATDFAGNTKSITRSFTITRPLQVSVVGSGSVTSGYAGASFRVPGTRYTIMAMPRTGYIFAYWTVNDATGTGITPSMLNARSLSFTFTEGLALTATFVPTPFTATTIGTFNGLVTPSSTEPAPSGTVANNSTVGMMTGAITSIGTFAGRISIDGSMYPVMMNFDSTGLGRTATTAAAPVLVIKRAGKADLEITLQFDITGITGQITGTVTRRSAAGVVEAVSVATLYRSHFNSLYKVPPEFVGRYNLILPPRASQPGLTTAQYPQGTGTGSMTVTATGTATIMLTLSDGTASISTAPLSRVLTCTQFASLYTAKGFFAAAFTIDPAQPDTDVSAMNSFWVRPAQPTQPGYRAGWPAGISQDVVGAKYVTPTGLAPVVPGLGPVNSVNGNATIAFTQGRLSAPVTYVANINPTGTASILTIGAIGSSLVIAKPTGDVNGSFLHPSFGRTTFRATVIQKAGIWQGTRGSFRSNASVPPDGLSEAGNVLLQPR